MLTGQVIAGAGGVVVVTGAAVGAGCELGAWLAGAVEAGVVTDEVESGGTSRSEGPSAKAWRSPLKRAVKSAVVGSVLLSKSM